MSERPETLVAIDFDGGTLDITPVVEAITAAGAMLDRTVDLDWQDFRGVTRPRHEITFDANVLRNTEVHGIGYRAGFIVHIES